MTLSGGLEESKKKKKNTFKHAREAKSKLRVEFTTNFNLDTDNFKPN